MARSAIRERLPFSPRQHRAREIRWHPWGPKGFQAARRDGLPILLAITTWWSDACHRMDETSYSDQGVIDRIQAGYLAMRVDSDRRPDVNDRYSWGGWPTTALLTPTGELLTSGGYLPPQELAALLDRVSGWYAHRPEELRQAIISMEARRRQLLQYTLCPPNPPQPDLLEGVAADLQDLYDPMYGGFGDQPKYPHADALRFALRRSLLPDGRRWREIAVGSLAGLAAGLLDGTEGGFFRSSGRRDWTDPHTEKLLEVNADLALLFLEAFQATGEAGYRDLAERTFGYLHATLRDPDSAAFGSSQAADGEYYAVDGAARSGTRPPAVDRTIIAEGNARAALAYLAAFRLTADPDRLRTATRLLDFLWERMATTEEGMVRYWDGRSGGPHLLRDQIWVALALAEAYDATADENFLEKATLLAEVILRDFSALPAGFHDIRAERDAPGGLANRQWNPVENAQVARLMVRLARFGGDGRYLEAARSALQLFSGDYSRFGPLEGSYALALEEYFQVKQA